MTAKAARTTSLIDHLQEQGYEPEMHDDLYGASVWYDLTVSGTGTVRVCTHPDDGDSADVYTFDRHLALEWSAKFSPGTPDAAIIATVEAAEWQLAAKRGGPVTPAQAKSAR